MGTENNYNKYAEVQRSKEAHSYSPSIQKLIDLAVSFVPYVEQAYRDGRKVVWYEGGSWYPLISGCGVIPALFVEIYRFVDEDTMRFAQEELQIPNETCAMAQYAIADFYLRKDSTIKRIVGSSIGCEPLLAGFQFIKKYGYDMFTIDGGFIPPDEKRFDHFKSFIADECHRLIDWLIGEPVNKELLRTEQIRFNRIQHKINKIIELRKKHTTYLKSVPMVLIFCGNGHYFGRAEEYEEALDGIISELSALKPGEYDEAVARIAWVGQRGGLSTMEAIDEAGGALTSWYTAGSYDTDIRTDIDPVEAAIDFSAGDRYYCGTTEDKCKVIEEQIREGGENGLILCTMLGCSFGSIEQELERMYFQKRDIPSLAIAGTFEKGRATGQMLTRIKAFVEMLS